ncbi:hypothetical protein Tco_0345326 [Tanacetum coccineum]
MATTKTHIVTTPSKRGSSNGDVTSPKSAAPTSSPAKSTGGDVTTKGGGGGGVADHGVSLKATMTEFSGKGSVAVNGDGDNEAYTMPVPLVTFPTPLNTLLIFYVSIGMFSNGYLKIDLLLLQPLSQLKLSKYTLNLDLLSPNG